MRRGRRSSGGRQYDAPIVPRETPRPAPREARWDYSWTLDRLRRSQPDPFVGLIPAELRAQQFQAPQVRQVSRRAAPRNIYVGDFLVDRSTGEIVGRQEVVVSDPCARSKDDRRSAVIRSGHGGVNGVRKYAKHKECK